MFLKSFLARNDGMSSEDAKNSRKFGHNLPGLVGRILQVSPTPLLAEVEKRLNRFPEVADRYTGRTYNNLELWNAYKVAQVAAAEVIRAFTQQNTRSRIASRF
jgi:hypothetical protein